MRFDDRLLTVLSQPGSDPHDVAVRWRQLVDLVARAGASAGSRVVEQALESIREDAPRVHEGLRAAAARAIAALPLPLPLLEYFASDRLTVSAPVLAAATLEPGQWSAILNGADEETRQFVEALHPELRPAKDFTDQFVAAPGGGPELPPSLHDVVERIERRRRTRAAIQRRGVLSNGVTDAPGLFRWEAGPGGDIAWVEGAPRGALIGRSIAREPSAGEDSIDADVVRSFMLRAPFRDAVLTLGGEGPLAGEWRISGVPAFEPSDGRFAGYRGIALRSEQVDAAVEPHGRDLLADADSVRELVHEIKTPLNAIIGFAEIIEGQYLGPAERVYRERAQEIVAQARLLVTAIDDLDFAARIHSSAAGRHPRVNLGELLERIAPALREMASSQGVTIDASRPIRETLAAAEPELADRLIFRLCSAVLKEATAGERLRLSIDQSGDRWRVSIARPARLARAADSELFDCATYGEQRFGLRLVRGLAKTSGAELVAPAGSLALLFRRA